MAISMVLLIQVLLWIWFLGAVITYRFGKLALVDGEGIKSAEFIVLCLYSAGIAVFHTVSFGVWILLGILILWFVVQFFCHWYYTIFGASEAKLRGYNDCFKDTVRIFPMSETRLVPDLYHIVLHVLIMANILICIAKILST